MKNYKPIIIQNINLTLDNIHVKSLRINQNVPESVSIMHKHNFYQIVIMLDGKCNQVIESNTYIARPGSVFFIAPDIEHVSNKILSKNFLAIYLDLELDIGRGVIHDVSQLNSVQFNKVKTSINELFQKKTLYGKKMMLKAGSVILNVLDIVLRPIGWLEPQNRFASQNHWSTSKIVERAMNKYDDIQNIPLTDLAEKVGFKLDKINRMLKDECGMSLGQLRSSYVLRIAQDMLKNKDKIQNIAKRVGFEDNNYFSRWFKSQTGYTPSEWKRRNS